MKKESTAAVPAERDESDREVTSPEGDHAELVAQLLAWYAASKRDLPWRRTRDPYAIWISEVMLQQTRVETVVPYYERFLGAFPTVHALAEAPLDDVLARWSGLGYYRRARALHEAARAIAQRPRATFPDTVEELLAVRGIGPYTAGAVASIAFGRRAAAVDGNVARVLARLFAFDDDVRSTRGLARVRALAEALVPERAPGAWNEALMELGATVCTPRAPRCLVCPVRGECRARALGRELTLPVLAPKKAPRGWRRDALVAVRGDRVLFARRRADGLFGGMWEPPMLDRGSGSSGGRLAALVGLEGGLDARKVGVATHVLSHRRLDVAVYRAELDPSHAPGLAPSPEYEDLALLDATDLSARGASTLCRKILAAARSPL